MKNKLLRISITFLTIFLLVLNMCPISFAVEPDSHFSFPIQRPVVDDYSGYIEVLTSNPVYGYIDCTVFTFSFSPISLDTTVTDMRLPQFHIKRSDNSITLQVSAGSYSGHLVVGQIPSSGEVNFTTFDLYQDPNSNIPPTGTVTFSFPTGAQIDGVHCYGVTTYTASSSSVNMENLSFFVTYSEASVLSSDLGKVLATLNSILSFLQNYDSPEDWEYDYTNDFQNIFDSLNNIDSSISSFKEQCLSVINDLVGLCNDVLGRLDTVLEKLDLVNQGLEDIFLFLETWIIDIDNWLQEIYWIELDSNGKLYEIKDTLDAILAILNAGKDKPTLQTPNDSIDSAFGDVSGWFSDIDGFGDQLEQNRQENQQNLAQAGNIISGFFNICPPQIIIALALCAIMIVIAKVIGR